MPTIISGDNGIDKVANGAVDLTTDVTGLLPQGNGGTGASSLSVSGTLKNIQYFTTAGTATYTPTSGTTFVIVEVVGGGGGGAGNTTNYTAGSGGGGGGFARKKITSGFSGVTVTVGAGGTTGTGNGGTGGTSSFGALVSATGGAGGTANQSGNLTVTVSGGTGSGGDINCTGGTGYMYMTNGTPLSVGGGSIYGFSVVTPNNANVTNGVTSSYGGGGSGGCKNAASPNPSGGSGGQGLVIVYEYA